MMHSCGTLWASLLVTLTTGLTAWTMAWGLGGVLLFGLTLVAVGGACCIYGFEIPWRVEAEPTEETGRS